MHAHKEYKTIYCNLSDSIQRIRNTRFADKKMSRIHGLVLSWYVRVVIVGKKRTHSSEFYGGLCSYLSCSDNLIVYCLWRNRYLRSGKYIQYHDKTRDQCLSVVYAEA